nr:LuxR C-terminal-related transcriptional regulator [Mameliella sp. CS4]
MTPREAEVLKHLARGKTNKEITRDLDVSPKTVDNHLQNLFRKIGANTRSVAAM